MRYDEDNDWDDDVDDEFDEYDADEYDVDDDDESETIPCPYCRQPVHEDAEWCPHCEQYLSVEDAPPSPKPWWIVLGVVACLAVLLWWIVALR